MSSYLGWVWRWVRSWWARPAPMGDLGAVAREIYGQVNDLARSRAGAFMLFMRTREQVEAEMAQIEKGARDRLNRVTAGDFAARSYRGSSWWNLFKEEQAMAKDSKEPRGPNVPYGMETRAAQAGARVGSRVPRDAPYRGEVEGQAEKEVLDVLGIVAALEQKFAPSPCGVEEHLMIDWMESGRSGSMCARSDDGMLARYPACRACGREEIRTKKIDQLSEDLRGVDEALAGHTALDMHLIATRKEKIERVLATANRVKGLEANVLWWTGTAEGYERKWLAATRELERVKKALDQWESNFNLTHKDYQEAKAQIMALGELLAPWQDPLALRGKPLVEVLKALIELAWQQQIDVNCQGGVHIQDDNGACKGRHHAVALSPEADAAMQMALDHLTMGQWFPAKVAIALAQALQKTKDCS